MVRLTWWQRFWRRLTGPRASSRRRPVSLEATLDYLETPSLALNAEGNRLRVGVVSTRGNVREHNEDNFFVPGVASLRNGSSGPSGGLDDSSREEPPHRPLRGDGPAAEVSPATGPPGLFIVADGMGGQQAGERASQLAVELIPVEFARRLDSATDERSLQLAVRDAVARANAEILAQSHLQPEYAQMGTTVVLAYLRHGQAYIAGIGDSRVYHLRGSRLVQLTRDHSLANALGEAGTIRPEEVETHRFKHVLYLYLGSKDVADGPEEIKVIEYRSGDQFLLATDGLTGVVKDDVIAEVLRTCEDPQRAAQQLINRALENRSKDNITCVVIKVV